MTRLEAFNDIDDIVRKYLKIEHPEYTTSEQHIVLDLLNDIERLLTR